MLRSKIYQNRRQLQGLAASCCLAAAYIVEEINLADPSDTTRGRISDKIRFPELRYRIPVASCDAAFAPSGYPLYRRPTVELLEETAKDSMFESSYQIYWKDPIGVGTFGNVYQARNRRTGEAVAVKKISKRFTNDSTFQREMEVLLRLESTGGHPSICLLQEHFDEGDSYYLVFDLVEGGELFDQLCCYGAYSEADAARMIRQTASALAFLHGVGIVHSDLKPENLMLSSKKKEEATIKIVDFGCAHISTRDKANHHGHDHDHDHKHRGTGLTPAYCPPEVLIEMKDRTDLHADIQPGFDMWSLGVILYIVLTGVHPFDLKGGTSSEEMEETIVSDRKFPIRDSRITKQLSEEALCVLEGLMERDPNKRWTAEHLLESSWVQGKTASSEVISGLDRRLAEYRRHKTKIGSSIFKGLLTQADRHGGSNFAKRTSILEMAFRDLDPTQRGYISTKELNGVTSFFAPDAKLSLSEVQQLLSENMAPKYMKKGAFVYEEGSEGNAMYFLHSGTVEVTSKDGFRTVREAGDFFGEDALMNDKRNHLNSVRCITPVHVLEIKREYFDKYLKADQDVALTMVETDRLRQRERAKVLFGLQKDLKPKSFKRGDIIFEEGSKGDNLYIMDEGEVNISVEGQNVRSLRQGEMTGEHAAFYSMKSYNVTAQCLSDECKLQVLDGRKIRKLCEKNSDLKASFRDIILRRDFKKAVVKATKRDFPQGDKELREVFQIIDQAGDGEISFTTLKRFVLDWDAKYSDGDIQDMMRSLDLNNSGSLTWGEFKRIFSMFNET